MDGEAQLYFAVLGPLCARTATGADVTPSGRLQRLLLATLLVHANRPVPVDTLVDVIWPGDTSARPQGKLQLAVHRLRAVLDSSKRIAYDAAGYRIRVADDEYDVARLDALASRLLVDDPSPAEAASIAQEALSLWRGEAAFEDVEHLVTAPEVTRCAARRQWLFETWCEAEIARGRQAAVLPELQARLAAHPLHERLHALLMRGLRAGARTAEALEVYTRARALLADELGLDPGPELQEEQAQALSGEVPLGVVRESAHAPAQLPPQPADLVGREDDLGAIDAALSADGSRIVVVTGTAGVGKTAAALAWAHRHRVDFDDGQLFVDLRGFSADAPVVPVEALAACLRSLGVDGGGMPAGLAERSSLFRSLVADRRVLLVLDNAASADQVRPLLPGGPSCAVLVTSRATLPGLGAREGARVVDLAPLAETASQRLLVDLIGDGAAGDTEAVRALGRWCGHLPLALRIAAQQVVSDPARSVGDLVAEISGDRDRLDLLDAGDGPDTDVRAVLSWSYDALPQEPARVFRLMGVLPGADADEAALAAVCDTDPRSLRRLLDTLVRAHLADRDLEGRYRQHDVLRAYAAELALALDDAAERDAATGRLLGFYARSAAGDPEQPDASWNWLERECGNVLAAVEAAGPAAAPHVLSLARSYGHFLRVSGRHADGLRLHTRELEVARATGDVAAENAAWLGLGNIKMRLGDQEGAEADYRAAIALSERTGDPLRRAAAVGNLGGLATDRGDLPLAEACLNESVEVFRRHGDHLGVTIGLCRLGDCRLLEGDPGSAQRHFEESLRLCDESGVAVARCEALVGLAEAAVAQREPERAERYAAAAVELAREHPGSEDEPVALSALAAVRIAQGRRHEAEELIRTALSRAHRLGAVDVTMSVLRRYVVAAGPHEADALRQEAVVFAVAHGFRGVATELRTLAAAAR